MGMISLSGIEYPPMPGMDIDSGMQSTTVDATGEKVAWIGPVWFEGEGNKNIVKAGWRFNTHVVAGGSGATFSLQNVSLTATPIQPDGTPDQTVAVTLPGTASWFKTNALSAARTVAKGEVIAAVLEFNGGGRLGADTIVVQNLEQIGTVGRSVNAGVSLFTAAWAIETCHPCLLLEFDDGTFGRLLGGLPLSTKTNLTFNSGSSPDEYALRLRPRAAIDVDGFWFSFAGAAGANCDFVLYEDNVALETVTLDADPTDQNARIVRAAFATKRRLYPGRVYDLACKPTTTTGITVYYLNLDVAAHRQALPGGTDVSRSTRTDGGAWTESTDRYIFAGFSVCGIPTLSPAMLVNDGGLVG